MTTNNYVAQIVAAHNAKITPQLIAEDDCRIERLRVDGRGPNLLSAVISTPVRDKDGNEVSRRNGQCCIEREPFELPDEQKFIVVKKTEFKSAFELIQLVALEVDLEPEDLVGPKLLKANVSEWTFEIADTNLDYYGSFLVVAV